MISNLTPSAEAFVANIERVQRAIAKANEQATSGKRVEVASDAPDELDTILQLRASESQNTQILSNLSLAKTDADTADGALTSANKLMDRARVLAAQGANYTQDATGRKSIADEIGSLQAQMVAISRTTVQGRYIFSGDQDNAPAYDLDLTQPGGINTLNPDTSSTRQVEDPAGGSFAVSKGAGEIFDSRNPDNTPASDNVFYALDNLRQALLANDSTQITDAINGITAASTRLSTSQAFYGSVQNRIQDATDYGNGYDVRLKTELGQQQDADLTAAALEISQGNLQLQAAFQMQAKM